MKMLDKLKNPKVRSQVEKFAEKFGFKKSDNSKILTAQDMHGVKVQAIETSKGDPKAVKSK